MRWWKLVWLSQEQLQTIIAVDGQTKVSVRSHRWGADSCQFCVFTAADVFYWISVKVRVSILFSSNNGNNHSKQM